MVGGVVNRVSGTCSSAEISRTHTRWFATITASMPTCTR